MRFAYISFIAQTYRTAMLSKLLSFYRNEPHIFVLRSAVSLLFAVTFFIYFFDSSPFFTATYRFFLLTCAFVILWIEYRYDMLLIFSLVFATGFVLLIFLDELGMALAIVLFPVVGIVLVFSRMIGGERLPFPPMVPSFLSNIALALFTGSAASVFIFFDEHWRVYDFPFGYLLSTFLLFWLWFKVESERTDKST